MDHPSRSEKKKKYRIAFNQCGFDDFLYYRLKMCLFVNSRNLGMRITQLNRVVRSVLSVNFGVFGDLDFRLLCTY